MVVVPNDVGGDSAGGPGQLFVRRDIREVRACTNPKCPEGGAVVRGSLGDKVIAGGGYGSALIAEIVVKKYRDGMSLRRIGQWLEREGFTMPSASMSDQVLWAADLLSPIWRALLDIERHPDARVKPLNVQRLTDIDDIDRS